MSSFVIGQSDTPAHPLRERSRQIPAANRTRPASARARTMPQVMILEALRKPPRAMIPDIPRTIACPQSGGSSEEPNLKAS